MKRFMICILSIIFSQSLFPQSNWKWLAPNPPMLGVYSSCTVDDKVFLWCDNNSVIKLNLTNDEFQMLSTYTPYNQFSPGLGKHQGIAFADSLNGFITDASHGDFRTTNGGLNWTKTADIGFCSHRVLFATKQRGWKLGVGLYITNNGGNTWTLLSPPFYGTTGGTLSRMFALNENQLWVLKSFHYTGNDGAIWYSSDGGYNWQKLNTGLISDSANQVSYSDIRFTNSGTGIAVGSIYRADTQTRDGFIQTTSDMGSTWSIIYYPDEFYENVISINEDEWLVLGGLGYYNDSNVIQRKTNDAGKTWTLSFPLNHLYSSSHFSNAVYTSINDKIYLFATLGVYKSEDRGNTYSKITSETDIMVSKIVFDSKPVNNDEQIAVAWNKGYDYRRKYLISFNAGYTWQQKSIPEEFGRYIWLFGISEGIMYVIVEQERIYRSTDYGETWQQLTLPVYNTGLQALNVFSGDILTLKAYKNLVSSTDGGQTWLKGPMVENIWLKESQIVSPGKVIGAGAYYDTTGTRGAFFKTTDFGLSWYITDTQKELNNIWMTDELNGYSSSSVNVFRTTTGGASWQSVLNATEFNKPITALAFTDSINGIVAQQYVFKKTSDGGKTWVDYNAPLPLSGISQLCYNAKGDLFVVGNYSLLMLPSQQTYSTDPNPVITILPDGFKLNQNYPNPFNPSTKISWQSPVGGHQTLKIYDVLGREVATLVNEYRDAGSYEVEFSAIGGSAFGGAGSQLASGVYYYQLKVGDLPDGKAGFVETRKMILMK